MSTSETGLNTTQHSALQVSEDTPLERWLLARVCQPLVERLPGSLHPNTISLTNSLLCWLLIVLALNISYLTPSMALIVRSGVAG